MNCSAWQLMRPMPSIAAGCDPGILGSGVNPF
jgi:hypothetical protein